LECGVVIQVDLSSGERGVGKKGVGEQNMRRIGVYPLVKVRPPG
jgi:hypothetical protein